MNHLVSIIMPVYNAEKYVSDAIKSVINQTHENWELIIINDGSIDKSAQIINNIIKESKGKIRLINQENKGVSYARNEGLKNVNGQYYCFLDADDIMPKNSLSSRIKVFKKNDHLSFVDGSVQIFNQGMDSIEKKWHPKFEGNPFKDLLQLTGKSFFGLTWMIKNNTTEKIYFKTELSHGEDLMYFIELSRKEGLYSYTKDTILKYRNTPNSAMKKVELLQQGYELIEKEINRMDEVDIKEVIFFKKKYQSFMVKEYMKKGKFLKAIKLYL